jgi:hypothetical protein
MKASRFDLRICVLLVVLPASVCLGQGNLLYLFGDEIGQAKTNITYSAGHFCQQGVEDQDTSMSYQDHGLGFWTPLYQCQKRELGFFGNVDVLDIDTRARLPRNDVRVPAHLWDVSLGLSYRQKLDNGHIAGASLSLGSASDQPFASWDEMTVSANLLYRIPAGENDAWLFMLNWSTDRDFLPYVPLPGVGYLWKPNDQLQVLAGVPFSMVQWDPLETLHFTARYAMLRNVHGKVSYDLTRQLSLYGSFDWEPRVFYRHDRHDDDDRLHFYEKRATVGLRWSINKHVYVDFSGGYAFNRFLFEDDDWDDRHDNRVDLGDGPFAGIQIGIRF